MEIYKQIPEYFKMLTQLPAWAYFGLVSCCVVALTILFFALRSIHNSEPSVVELSKLKFSFEKINLIDITSATHREILPYRLIVNWLIDSVVKDQETAHLLYLAKSSPISEPVSTSLLKVRVKSFDAKHNAEWTKLSVLPIIRHGDFIRIEGLDPSSGEPSGKISQLSIEKPLVIKDLRKGDQIVVVVLIKASSVKLFERVGDLPANQLFTIDLQRETQNDSAERISVD